MTAEDWLRERGIEVKRQDTPPPGQFARYPTSALPHLPGSEEDITGQETQHVPSVVHIDVRLGGDVTEWPTAALPESVVLDDDNEPSIFISDFDEFHAALEEEMTVPLPVIPALPSSTPPSPIIVDAKAMAEDADEDGDISSTPTRRLEG